MHLSISLVTALLAAGSAIALPSTNHVVHERRSEAASLGLAKRGAAPAGQLMPMKVALTQKNLHQIPQLLDDVSNPDSPSFGKHWTGDELARKFGPSDRTVKAVKSWLAAAGIRAKVSANRHWVEFEATVEQAEQLLKTKYHVYGGSNKSGSREHIGCDHYSLPGHVREHVDFITPTVSVSELRRSISRRDAGAAAAAPAQQVKNVQHTHFQPVGTDGAEGAETPAPPTYHNGSGPSVATCAQGATPDCFRALYGIPHGTTATMGNPLGIYESEDYYDQQDLDAFFTAYAPEIENGTAPMLNSIDGGGDISSTGNTGYVQGESVLDLQVAYPLIHPQGVRLLQVDDVAYQHSAKHGHFDSLLDALDASFCTFMGGDNSTYDFAYPDSNQTGGYNGTKMCGSFAPPTVISISYGYQEDYFSAQYLKRQCLEFAKLAMAGSTVVASSGDSGLSAPYCANPKLRVATPQFPASCPYVTTVGATMLDQTVPSLADDAVEMVATDSLAEFKAGAGFSTVFDMPDWQKDVVTQYLASAASSSDNSSAAMQPGKNFNPSGRAYPDISALGTNITTITNNRAFLADGTSASAPMFASMITLINEERMSAGKGPVGFINPALYKAGAAQASSSSSSSSSNVFRDVTKGDNAGCGMPGFKAVKGWDATTGWGTPKYDGLRDLLVGLP